MRAPPEQFAIAVEKVDGRAGVNYKCEMEASLLNKNNRSVLLRIVYLWHLGFGIP